LIPLRVTALTTTMCTTPATLFHCACASLPARIACPDCGAYAERTHKIYRARPLR
jgi:hypothetical protein